MTVKVVVYRRKLTTLTELRREIGNACAEIQRDILVNVSQEVVHLIVKYLDANGHHIENL